MRFSHRFLQRPKLSPNLDCTVFSFVYWSNFCWNVERRWNCKSNSKSFLLIPLLLHPKWLVECDRRALLYLKRRIEIFFVKTQLALMGSNSASSWKKNREANICPTKWKKWHLRPISWEKLPSILKVWPWLRKKEKPIIKKYFATLLLEAHCSEVQKYEQGKIGLQIFDMWC